FFNCRQASAGEILWREGEGCDSLAIIIDGRVDIKKATEFEGKEVIVGVYGRGSVVGELCFLDQAPREVTVVALEDTNLLLLTRDNFDRLLEEQPAAAIRLLQGMLLAVSSRLRSCFDRLASIF
ncbi:MAG: cyclic nucleotide-binding domain-containing protein, partial [Desulfuromonadales bacterium]|nr:cyclic nucleotide-binding domain-containing protein [Desulfuromonadales bacterium]